MSFKVIIDEFDRSEWERRAGEFDDYSIYQTWPYQQVRADMAGQSLSRAVVIDEKGAARAMCQVRMKHVPAVGLRIGYIQWGPLVRGMDGELRCCPEVLTILRQAYVGPIVNVLRIVPNAEADGIGAEFERMLDSAGFERLDRVKPYYTMIVKVDGSEEAIRSRLHRSWRRGLYKAERNGLEIKEGANGSYFEILRQMYIEAQKRKDFKGLDPREFVQTQMLLAPSEKMNVVVAYCDGEPVASHATSHLGTTAVGTLAATNAKGLECSATYLVWWKTFLAAGRAGMKRYDLGGIDPKKNPRVYQFKQRMGAQEVHYIGEYEFCASRAVKAVAHVLEKAYRLVRR